jgi:NADPH-dependent F420 reductase
MGECNVVEFAEVSSLRRLAGVDPRIGADQSVRRRRLGVRGSELHASLRVVKESEFDDAIAILGGTGDQGLGLALRFAQAGRPVVIGSRKLDRAATAEAEVKQAVPGGNVTGLDNPDATRRARTVILSVPFEHTAGTVKSIRDALVPGQIVVSMGVPLASSIGGAAAHMIGVWQGSCAELVAGLVPEGVEVISAFQNVSAHRLRQLDEPVECDVVVSGTKGPRTAVMELCGLIPGLRAVDGGPLGNARIVESITALLIGMNIRYRVSDGIGVRFTGLPSDDS